MIDRGTVITDDGEEIPVTNMLDADGNETDDPLQTVVIVAGPDRDGMWHTIPVAVIMRVEPTPRYLN